MNAEAIPNCSDEAFASYIECALWSTTFSTEDDDGNETIVDGADMEQSDLEPESLSRLRADLSRFLHENAALLWDDEETFASDRTACSPDSFERDSYSREEIASHDLWYTQNGHGTGFWDRDEVWGEANAKALTEAAKAFGERDLYIGDDGKIYVD